MPIGEPLVILPTVDSTNKYAMQQVHAHLAIHGMAWFTHEQTQGRGQRGNEWKTSVGENIILSVSLAPNQAFPSQPFLFNAAIALACYEFYKNLAGDETAIKWPNDIYWRDRKAGGILVDNMLSGSHWRWSVVGIGINVNQVHFDPALPNPVSLKEILGYHLDPLALSKELLIYIDKYWNLWRTGNKEIMQRYNEILFKRGQPARFRVDNRVFEDMVIEVNATGQLVLASGQSFDSGQIALIVSG
jgi:BirA family biotin operon repressor/biotin-[acetyl-CoA-carboxylase] ligase